VSLTIFKNSSDHFTGGIEERHAEETMKVVPSPPLLIDEIIGFEKCSLFRIVVIG
jgi:hypothetical protein